MRLPHHPQAIESLRTPTEQEPWRVLISGCLYGWKVAVDGTNYGLDQARPQWLESPLVQVFPFCPEDDQLGTPRSMPDLHGGDGFDVLAGSAKVLDPDGIDLTKKILAGAEAMARLAQEQRVDFALLTDRSGSCGSQVISLGCRFEEPVQYQKGVGVAAARLLQDGVHVVSQRDFLSLEKLRAKLEPGYQPDATAVDHHEHPWVREHLA